MNSFQQHLNWTLLLAIIASNVLVYLWSTVTPSNGDLDATALLLVPAVGISIGTEIWYLKQKGRSLWNLLWNPLPYVGFIIILTLENHNKRVIK